MVIRAATFFRNTLAAVGFIDYRNGNFELGPSSKYKGRASNRKDPGVDLNALGRALSVDARTTTPSK